MTTKEEATIKICKDCKYHYGINYHRCTAPALRQTDLVTGEYLPFCSDERKSGTICGQQGKLFEPRISIKHDQRMKDFAANYPRREIDFTECGKATEKKALGEAAQAHPQEPAGSCAPSDQNPDFRTTPS